MNTPLTQNEIAARLRVKQCEDGRIRLARVGFVGKGENATAAMCWHLPVTREDRFEANRYREAKAKGGAS